MAVVDVKHNAVVIRIVYDGPPYAGKTTSVRALAQGLGRTVDTPVEADGRTMFFDWMEYTGGLFEGRQIRCQVVTVPGQPDLAARRRALLEAADVVVFVADSGDRAGVERSVASILELKELLRANGDARVSVIVQANKRDLPEAMSRDELRAALGDDFAHTALTESVAETGLGIRETFVLAVRLALDRARVQLQHDDEYPAPMELTIEGPEQLLATLERLPVGPRAPAVGGGGGPAVVSPRLPDTSVPSGAIWPPVQGRMVLHEAVVRGQPAQATEAGDWVAGVGAWQVHSACADVFDDFEQGRRALLTWAGEHAVLSELLSPARCVVLAEAGDHTWRLWQIVRSAPSLRSWLIEGATLTLSQLYRRLIDAAALLAEAHSRCQGSRLQPRLETIGAGGAGTHYVALMPPLQQEARVAAADIHASIVRELTELLCAELSGRLSELELSVVSLWCGVDPWDAVVTAAIAATWYVH